MRRSLGRRDAEEVDGLRLPRQVEQSEAVIDVTEEDTEGVVAIVYYVFHNRSFREKEKQSAGVRQTVFLKLWIFMESELLLFGTAVRATVL